MHFTSRTLLDDGVIEREFTLDAFTGILWMPPTAAPSSPVPLLLLNQPGGLGTRRMYPRLVARAHAAAADGFASVTIELPGTGNRPPLPGAEQARIDLRAALAAGEKPSPDVIDRLVLPLVEAAVPEWQATLDAVLALPGTGSKVGSSGGVIAVGVRLAVVEPRIAAAGLCAGSYVPLSTMDEARRVTIPLHMLCGGRRGGMIVRPLWICSTRSVPLRRRWRPTWVGTRGCRRLRGRMRGGSLCVTSLKCRAEADRKLRPRSYHPRPHL